MLGGEHLEAAPRQHIAHQFIVRLDRRRACFLVEQRHFAEHSPGREGDEAGLALGAREPQPHTRAALGDDVELVAVITFTEHDLSVTVGLP